MATTVSNRNCKLNQSIMVLYLTGAYARTRSNIRGEGKKKKECTTATEFSAVRLK